MAKALVIDPSASSARTTQKLLESLGIEAESRGSVESMLPAADLVLVDAGTSLKMSGDMSAVEAVRQANPLSCLIFLIEDGGQATIKAAMEAGADDYLVKPFSRDLLAFKLAQSQARGRLRQDLLRQGLHRLMAQASRSGTQFRVAG